MIKLQIIGNIGNDAIVNDVNGKKVINFNVAHSEKYKNAQGVETQKTIWVSCSYWVDKVVVAQYLKKGTQVYVEGQPDVDMYEDRNRQMHAKIKLRVLQIQLLGSGEKPDSGSVSNGQQTNNNSVPSVDDITEPIDDSDLPF